MPLGSTRRKASALAPHVEGYRAWLAERGYTTQTARNMLKDLGQSLLQAGVDTTVIALWLGHAGVRSTDAYVHADMTIKENALALTAPVTAQPGRYRPTDKVLAFLDRL
ncbi:hypothetical protein [Streptomyces sp. NPDC001020]